MLSERLFQLAHESTTDNAVSRGNHNFQRWIWRWLYLNQPAEQLEDDLRAIEELIDAQHLKTAQLVALAIKAETLESMLAQ